MAASNSSLQAAHSSRLPQPGQTFPLDIPSLHARLPRDRKGVAAPPVAPLLTCGVCERRALESCQGLEGYSALPNYRTLNTTNYSF